jgi:hypothetical protein
MLMSPCHYDGYLDPSSVENRIWGDGIGSSRCDAGGSRLLFGAIWVWPKSKDRFMERPPMKIVLP